LHGNDKEWLDSRSQVNDNTGLDSPPPVRVGMTVKTLPFHHCQFFSSQYLYSWIHSSLYIFTKLCKYFGYPL
jgi:hypothetical protein